MSESDSTVSVIIVRNDLAERVRAYAAELAESQASEVTGFSAGFPDMSRFGSILGRADTIQAGGANMLTGTNCDTTSAKATSYHADDFNCTDEP